MCRSWERLQVIEQSFTGTRTKAGRGGEGWGRQELACAQSTRGQPWASGSPCWTSNSPSPPTAPPPHVQGGKARGGWLLKFSTPFLPGGWRGETRLNGTLKLCTADQLLL